MALGQSAGPPAHARQLETLSALLIEAGHTDFRDARGPMGFTSRQASGRFTRDEADAFIQQLEGVAHDPTAEGATASTGEASVASTRKADANVVRRTAVVEANVPTAVRTKTTLRDISSERLAAELQRRGWIVVEP